MCGSVRGHNENNIHYCDDGDDTDDFGGCLPPQPVGPGGAVEEMDRMKIIKRRLSMSLRSARPVDDSLSELAEQMALDEPTTARDNGETCKLLCRHAGTHKHVVCNAPAPK